MVKILDNKLTNNIQIVYLFKTSNINIFYILSVYTCLKRIVYQTKNNNFFDFLHPLIKPNLFFSDMYGIIIKLMFVLTTMGSTVTLYIYI